MPRSQHWKAGLFVILAGLMIVLAVLLDSYLEHETGGEVVMPP